MKKYFIKSCLAAIIVTSAFTSCSDSDNVKPKEEVKWEEGAFILNEGSWKGNNSKLSYYNKESGKLVADIFEEQNGKKLGDTAQDIIIYGGKMYITVNESRKIYVTDLKAKIVEGGEISTEKTAYDFPRYLAAHNGFVYISSYNGALAKLDTTNLKVVGELPVPKFSEKITISADQLFIADSQQGDVAGKTVTVVDLNTFTLKKAIDVIYNPTVVVSDNNNNIFASSITGNEVSKINANTLETTNIKGSLASNIAVHKNRLLMYNMDFSNYPKPATVTFSQYDIAKDELSNTPFLKVETMPEAEKKEIDKIYHISVDPKTSDIYVTTSDFSTTGSVYIFDEQGNYKKHFKSGGISPQKTVFVSHKLQLID